MIDPYQVLGIQRGVSDAELQKAYKKLAMQYHPDRNPGDKVAEEKFKEINAARDAITSGAADQPQPQMGGFGGPGMWQFNGANLDEIFAALHAQQTRRNRDITVECQISLEEAFHGTEINVNVRNQTQNRSISVKIPAGVDQGNRMRVPQAGENQFPSMTPGDLFVNINIRQHPRFQRRGQHLYTSIAMDVFDILLGNSIQVECIDGTKVDVKVPSKFDPENHLKVQGHGMVLPNNNSRGDLFLSIRPKFPELNESQKSLIQSLRVVN